MRRATRAGTMRAVPGASVSRVLTRRGHRCAGWGPHTGWNIRQANTVHCECAEQGTTVTRLKPEPSGAKALSGAVRGIVQATPVVQWRGELVRATRDMHENAHSAFPTRRAATSALPLLKSHS
jgi:hypothetical protein